MNKMVPMNKMGSKLAQGVRKVMEQGKTPEMTEKEAARQPTAPVVPEASTGRQVAEKVMNKTPARSRDAEYEISHPERIWPD